jgi:TonB family protein
MLGLEAGDEPSEPAPAPPASPGRSLLGLEGLAAHELRPDPREETPRDDAEEPVEEDLFHLERSRERAFPIERAILFSLAAHILLLLFFLHGPLGFPSAAHARKGLLAAFLPDEEAERQKKIPIVFRAAPGPARENNRPAPFSDKTRRAAGGDPSRPKSDTPFSPPRSGIDGLAQGRKAEASRAARPAAPRTAAESKQAQGRGETPPEKAPATAEAFKISPPGSDSGTAGPRSAADQSRLAGLDQAIRQAAREVQASGENGAGFPNPDGGFVDTGGLSFESTWFEWGDYWDAFVRRVKLHWKVPLDLMMLGAKGKVTITMAILADGRLADMRVVRPSGTIPFNFSAEQALQTSSPFRPLPKELLRQVPGKDRERVTVTFFYNLRPGNEGDAETR